MKTVLHKSGGLMTAGDRAVQAYTPYDNYNYVQNNVYAR